MSTYSSDLRIELIANGAQAGTWGTTTNDTWAYVIDPAITGFQTVAVSSANQALTYVSGSTATASANQAIYASLAFTTSTGANFNVYAPPAAKQYIIWNNSSYSMTLYNSTVLGNTTAAGAGVTIPAGNKIQVFSTGVNFYSVEAANLTGTLAIANGGTGATTASAARTSLGVAIGTDVPSPTGTGASGTWSISVSGNAATATNPAGGGSFITSSNIGSQSVSYATTAGTANAAAAGSITPAMLSQPLTLATAVATNTGATYYDIGSIPSWVKRISISLYGVSTNDATGMVIQLGSGGIVSSGYHSGAVSLTALQVADSYLLLMQNTSAGYQVYGTYTLTKVTGNTWAFQGSAYAENPPSPYSGSIPMYAYGGVALSGAVDTVRLTTQLGSSTFDNGTFNILYE